MSGHDHDHGHEHHHDHDHPHDHGPFQPDIEDRPLTHHQAMTEAVADLLLAKGIIEPVELRKMLEAIDATRDRPKRSRSSAGPSCNLVFIPRFWIF